MPIELRHANGKLDSVVTSQRVYHLAKMGLIEGVGPRSSVVKHVRWLPMSARMEDPAAPADTPVHRGRAATINAQTRLGVFRESLREPIVDEDPWGNRSVRAEGETFAHCYSFHLSSV